MIAMLGRDADPATARIIVDPNMLNPNGTTAVDWLVPSPDATKVAVSLSEGGSEDGSLHIFDVATGKDTGEVIPRVQYPTGGGSLAWAADGEGFYYRRYPGPEPAALVSYPSCAGYVAQVLRSPNWRTRQSCGSGRRLLWPGYTERMPKRSPDLVEGRR
jgi:prolyl oligopeptidase PreP (S9A serine peptidase family)